MSRIGFVATTAQTVRSFLLPQVRYLSESHAVSIACDGASTLRGLVPANVVLHDVPMRRGIHPVGALSAILRLRRIFRTAHLDLVQYATPNASLYAALAARWAKVPVRLYAQWGLLYVGARGLRRTLLRAIEKTVCRLSTEIEPISLRNLEFARSEGLYGGRPAFVVGRGSAKGIDTARFDVDRKADWNRSTRMALGIPLDAPIVGFMGRIRADKGFGEALAVHPALKAEFPTLRFLVCGEVEPNGGLDSRRLDAARRDPSILFRGQVDDPERHFACMDLFLFPTHREGFGEVGLEAQAMGVPVVASAVPGPADSVVDGETGLLFAVGDVATLHDVVAELLRNPDLRRRMGDAGSERARRDFGEADHVRATVARKILLLREAGRA